MLLLTLNAGANRYAVDAARVIEVIPKVELRTIPHAPPALAGFLGYRGYVVPVLDLSLLLGATPSQECLSTRIILVDDRISEHNRQTHDDAAANHDTEMQGTTRKPVATLLGLVAERVTDLAYTQPDKIMPSPVALPDAPYLGALIQTDQGIVQLIVVEQLRAAALPSSSIGQGFTGDLHRGLSPSIA